MASPLGRHVCGVAATPDAYEHMAARWVTDSLAADLQTVWVAADPAPVISRLEAAQVPWERAVAAGQLLFAAPEDVVGVDSEDAIPDRLAAAIALIDHAASVGHAGVSVGVDGLDAIAAMPDLDTQLAFEAAWERFTREHELALLCLYRPETGSEHLRRAVEIHPRGYADPLAAGRMDDGRLRLSGEVDISNIEHVRQFLQAAAADAGRAGNGIVVDLDDIAFIDIAGIRTLVELGSAVTPGRVRILHPPPTFERVLSLAGWDERVDVVGGAR